MTTTTATTNYHRLIEDFYFDTDADMHDLPEPESFLEDNGPEEYKKLRAAVVTFVSRKTVNDKRLWNYYLILAETWNRLEGWTL